MRRRPGISVLIAAQNEEAVVDLCLRSLLDFGDELIVVDNGSQDRTRAIAQDWTGRYPQKIRFFDRPELPDLYHNRQFAFERSSCEWIFRCDADYVAFTDGPYSILDFRRQLLARPARPWPAALALPQFNLVGDFFHTGIPAPSPRPAGDKGYYYPPLSAPMTRFFRYFPGLRFVRRGRWEGVRFQPLIPTVVWPHPVWVQCSVKSPLNFLFRSERTNWRQRGDFRRYPTLQSYVQDIAEQEYGTADLAQAARIYVERHVTPCLQPHDPVRHFPYPRVLAEHLAGLQNRTSAGGGG